LPVLPYLKRNKGKGLLRTGKGNGETIARGKRKKVQDIKKNLKGKGILNSSGSGGGGKPPSSRRGGEKKGRGGGEGGEADQLEDWYERCDLSKKTEEGAICQLEGGP